MPIVVVPKFTEAQPFRPLVGMSTDEASEIAFNRLIDTLRLTIGLGVIGSAHVQFCASSLENSLPEFASKDWISVRD
jgi:hypothetical protein